MKPAECMLAVVFSAAVITGCEEEKIISGRPKPQTAGAAASAAASASAQVAALPPAIDENEFGESDKSRDPFRSYALAFIEDAKSVGRSQRDVVLSEYTIDELKLIGIVTRVQPAKAMLVDPGGKGHVIQRGQFVGRADVIQTGGPSGTSYEVNWRVDRIREGDVVLVREDPANPDVPTATRVIPLRTEAELGGS